MVIVGTGDIISERLKKHNHFFRCESTRSIIFMKRKELYRNNLHEFRERSAHPIIEEMKANYLIFVVYCNYNRFLSSGASVHFFLSTRFLVIMILKAIQIMITIRISIAPFKGARTNSHCFRTISMSYYSFLVLNDPIF